MQLSEDSSCGSDGGIETPPSAALLRQLRLTAASPDVLRSEPPSRSASGRIREDAGGRVREDTGGAGGSSEADALVRRRRGKRVEARSQRDASPGHPSWPPRQPARRVSFTSQVAADAPPPPACRRGPQMVPQPAPRKSPLRHVRVPDNLDEASPMASPPHAEVRRSRGSGACPAAHAASGRARRSGNASLPGPRRTWTSR
jgi:hypothetical protein